MDWFETCALVSHLPRSRFVLVAYAVRVAVSRKALNTKMSLPMLALLPLSFVMLHPPSMSTPRCQIPAMAIDYKDPIVAKEFAAIQGMDTEAVEDELMASGIPAPPTMNDMDMRMMLVEVRLRKEGKIGDKKAPAKKAPPGASEFEVALYEKPGFKAWYEEAQRAHNTNALNLATEHITNPRRAKERYGATAKYDETIAAIEAALNMKVEQTVTTARIAFDGFPANMGEAGVKMTLEALGPIKEFTYAANDDGMTSSGVAEFDEVDMAKACVDKYDGMDMGLGVALTIEAL